ncbi:EF-hand calcium-binding domain-containing protein 11 isoform X2 [Tamandua tetradactyla]|uniref:EF-hand calcium-binding domain-containing protein 11 isoform X2 n=1 Tax=Tamandua tetradactyla TaxID=48850 RepID=UPI00405468BD
MLNPIMGSLLRRTQRRQVAFLLWLVSLSCGVRPGHPLESSASQPALWILDSAFLRSQVDSVMSSINQNTSGIFLEEFLNVVRKKKEAQLCWSEIKHIFTAFDMHYRGFLTLEDFQKAFKQVAPKLPERIIIEVFREVDQDSDGHISFKDFEYAMNYGQNEA